MNCIQKYLSSCCLATVALLVGASPLFAATVPSLGTAANFTVLSAAPNGGGAVTCTNSSIIGDVGSSGAQASVTRTNCTISGAVIAPVAAQVLVDFNNTYDQYASVSCTGTLNTA